jgi:hypothetical protein
MVPEDRDDSEGKEVIGQYLMDDYLSDIANICY